MQLLKQTAPPEIAYRFPKNEREEMRAELIELDGRSYINLRSFWLRHDGEPVPTRKGITLAADLLPELETAIAKLREAVRSRSERR